MNTKLIFITFFSILFNVNAQIEFQDHIITPNGSNISDTPYSVHSADMDGDNDIDILVADNRNNEIVWYENIDFIGDFTSKHIISSSLISPRFIYPADIDNDGDMDVVAEGNAEGGDRIVWFANTNGNGDFGPEQIISINVDTPLYVIAIDIDGDDNLDIVSSSLSNEKVAWYKNLNGNGSFGPQQIITQNNPNSNVDYSVFPNDLDGDNDIDIIVASFGPGKIVWYENTDGQGNFAEHIITNNADGVRSVYATDIEGDGDSDLIAGLDGPNSIVWYENLDGKGTFSTPKLIKRDTFIATIALLAADLDGDGDNDVISHYFGTSGRIVWFENIDGLGTFSFTPKNISTGKINLTSINVADINNDGKIDVLSTSQFDDIVAWHENSMSLSVNESSYNLFEIFPNPTFNSIQIKSNNHISKIEIFNNTGQTVLSNFNKKEIDISSLSQNIYLCKITDVNNFFVFKKVVKK